jgi:hypothetical protein
VFGISCNSCPMGPLSLCRCSVKTATETAWFCLDWMCKILKILILVYPAPVNLFN